MNEAPYYEDLLGQRFAEFGDGVSGWNCIGLVREMYRRNGVLLPNFNAAYRADGHPMRSRLAAIILAEAEKSWERIARPEPNTVVLLRVEKLPTHIGYMIDRLRFIHVLEDTTLPGKTDIVVVQALNATRWEHKIEGFYRWKG